MITVHVKAAGRQAEHDASRVVRRWNPDQHPRDKNGRFVETGGTVRLASGAVGKVVGHVGGKVQVRAGGRVVDAAAHTLEVVPPGTPAAARAAEPARHGAGRPERHTEPSGPKSATPKTASQDYPRMTPKQAEKWGSDNWPSTSPPLPADQRQALREYASGGYKDYNGYLRTGKPKATASDKRDIVAIDKALRDHPTPSKATVVHRGIDLDAFGSVTPDKLVGQTIHEPGYLSTSVGREVAGGFAHHDAHVEIKVPAGTPAFYMDNLTGFKGERELLLARGMQYKILSAKKNRAGKWQVQAEIVPTAKPTGDAAGIEPGPARAAAAAEADRTKLTPTRVRDLKEADRAMLPHPETGELAPATIVGHDDNGSVVEMDARHADGTVSTIAYDRSAVVDRIDHAEVEPEEFPDEVATEDEDEGSPPVIPKPAPPKTLIARPPLYTYQRQRIVGLQLDRDKSQPPEVRQAAAAVRLRMPLTAEQAAALADAVRWPAPREGFTRPQRRAIGRISDRLQATAAEVRGSGPPEVAGRTATVATDARDMTEGDTVALASHDGGIDVVTIRGIKSSHGRPGPGRRPGAPGRHP